LPAAACAQKRIRVSEASERLFAGPCEFIAGAATFDAIPPPRLPEIAFAGRSNVGKSSLINALTHRKSLARISQNPGATKQINFFELGETLILADLPGYGYARISKTLAQEWQTLIFSYLRGRPNLRRVIHLIDARRGLMPTDSEAMDLLDEAAVSYLVVLTKIDKLSPKEREQMLDKCKTGIVRRPAAYPDVLATSATLGEGLEALRDHIVALAAS
jgi:GTP-binding protein